MGETQTISEPNVCCSGTGDRQRRLENCPAQSASSALSDQLVKLSIWTYANSLSDLHALGSDRSSTRAVFVFVFGNAWPTRFKLGEGQDTPKSNRVLGLVRRFRSCRDITYNSGPHSFKIVKASPRRGENRATKDGSGLGFANRGGQRFTRNMSSHDSRYDVIVVGSGHAGVETALASAHLGCPTLLLTQNLDTIAQMSCNPAVGGLAKGHIVREIDALGGAMGLNADSTGIQYRMLNRTKGPSVRAPRAQCDKKAYQFRMKAVLERTPGLDIKQATVSRILVEDEKVVAVETDLGLIIAARSVVLTSGTFLRGLLHIG